MGVNYDTLSEMPTSLLSLDSLNCIITETTKYLTGFVVTGIALPSLSPRNVDGGRSLPIPHSK